MGVEGKPLKRLISIVTAVSPLKAGVNEKTELRRSADAIKFVFTARRF